jgi:hypothetical protein
MAYPATTLLPNKRDKGRWLNDHAGQSRSCAGDGLQLWLFNEIKKRHKEVEKGNDE